MSPIYTGAGDGGTTSLADGTRIPKDDPRVEAYGSVDECCSLLGVARSLAEDELLRDVLGFAQARLYAYAVVLACDQAGDIPDPAFPQRADADVDLLERAVDRFESATGPLDRFLVPGGCPLAAQLFYARAVTRRAERRVLAIADGGPGDRAAARFLNRLSDALFAAARYANHDAGRPDQPWDPDTPFPML